MKAGLSGLGSRVDSWVGISRDSWKQGQGSEGGKSVELWKKGINSVRKGQKKEVSDVSKGWQWPGQSSCWEAGASRRDLEAREKE